MVGSRCAVATQDRRASRLADPQRDDGGTLATTMTAERNAAARANEAGSPGSTPKANPPKGERGASSTAAPGQPSIMASPCQLFRSAIIGLTPAARRAGMYPATSATTPRRRIVATKVGGSVGSVSKEAASGRPAPLLPVQPGSRGRRRLGSTPPPDCSRVRRTRRPRHGYLPGRCLGRAARRGPRRAIRGAPRPR